MKKKDIIQLVKDAINEIGADAYGDATLTSQGQSKSRFTKTGRPPGVMEDKKPNLKSIADVDRSSWTPDGGGGSIGYMEYEDGTEMTPQEIQDYFEVNHELYDDIMNKVLEPKDLKENKENLKEFTDYGQEGIYPKKEKPGDMFQQKEVEDLFPHGMASRSDKAFQARVKQHADWTEQRAFNTTFVHMQYHETKGLEDEYFIYQTQHYNSNYDDFRNPKFTLLSITKNKDTEKEEDLGQYIVDTNAYIRDLNKLEERGNLGDRVMESLDEAHPLNKVIGSRPYSYIGGPTKGQYVLSGPMNDREKETIIRGAEQAGYIAKPNMGGGVTIFLKPPAVMDEAPMFRTGIKMDMAPEVMAPRIKKVFDAVNNSSRPEFFKNVFKGMYRIPFPENFEDITNEQAVKMNMFMNDMKNKIREAVVVSKTTSPGDAADLAKSANTTVDAVKTAIDQAKKTGDAVTVAELELTNDIGKDDYVDDEGRMAKSQLYKMAKYAVKLHGMLDDMEQLPAWVQAKFTKASDYLSSIYHYLDYEFARRDSDLMREMEKYKEAMLEEPNEISYDDAKKKGLKSPDKADISKDKDISDYELKRGMAIQKAIEKQK